MYGGDYAVYWVSRAGREGEWLVRLISRKTVPVFDKERVRPSLTNAVILILIISVCAFLIRTVEPIGTNILNMQLCFFASYIVLFIVGIIAYRNNLFARIGYQTGKRWLICGIVLGLLFWLVLTKRASAMPGGMTALFGGVTWESAVYFLWESFVAVAMSIGLIAVFREKFNYQSRFVKALSDNSFAVYMFHPPIIVAVSLLFRSAELSPIVKWVMLCVICIPLCFAITHFVIRKIPLLNKVL
ncbi:acyltransferase 3 [Lucifera butyrica]|uniref:Acyltransferase 3 n=1 Tax=Lucifera butyrica TaxID=1351585 RepID=A0A498RHB1_9FIRM|nr:acyltransferase family protein [Lucifera butyrica]VBB08528.1 acyltransferase 3 [Lucifera butyrica]